jgi:hypothetical protein
MCYQRVGVIDVMILVEKEIDLSQTSDMNADIMPQLHVKNWTLKLAGLIGMFLTDVLERRLRDAISSTLRARYSRLMLKAKNELRRPISAPK